MSFLRKVAGPRFVWRSPPRDSDSNDVGNNGEMASGGTAQVHACRLLRAMRGEARACLIEGDDGFAYVVKLTNNPQGGRRVLVNEFIGSILLTQLGVATPERAFVNIDDERMGDINNPLPKGTHFGSRYPGTPDTIAVYDF